MLGELSKESSGASAAAGNMWGPAVERGWALQEGASKEPCPQGFTVKHGHNGRTAASRAEAGGVQGMLLGGDSGFPSGTGLCDHRDCVMIGSIIPSSQSRWSYQTPKDVIQTYKPRTLRNLVQLSPPSSGDFPEASWEPPNPVPTKHPILKRLHTVPHSALGAEFRYPPGLSSPRQGRRRPHAAQPPGTAAQQGHTHRRFFLKKLEF